MRCSYCGRDIGTAGITGHVCVPINGVVTGSAGPATALPPDDRLVQRRIKLAQQILDGQRDDLVHRELPQ